MSAKRKQPDRASVGIRVPRRFGPASLTILGAPQVMDGTSGGLDCSTSVRNLTG
jgi:hypothetical protein